MCVLYHQSLDACMCFGSLLDHVSTYIHVSCIITPVRNPAGRQMIITHAPETPGRSDSRADLDLVRLDVWPRMCLDCCRWMDTLLASLAPLETSGSIETWIGDERLG